MTAMEQESSILPLQQIGHMDRAKVYTHEEAEELLPLLMVIAQKTKKELNNYQAQLNYFKNRQDKTIEFQNKMNATVQLWSDKMRRLGVVPLSLCKVRINGESMQYFWEYPENRLYWQEQ